MKRIKYVLRFVVISGLLMLQGCTDKKSSPASEPTPFIALVGRLIPTHADQFVFEQLPDSEGSEVFELESKDAKIVIRANTVNAAAVGLNHYLKYYCNTSVSWFAHDPVELPEKLPAVPEKVIRKARCKNRFFLNYCTFGYTMPWWQWSDWERLIDWMALNGINRPLAITGQEAIWYRVWRSFGLSDEQIRNYFTGPAHLPWHRMSNLDKWQGPLPHSWLDQQLDLQKKIVHRQRQLGMTPILPAFAGHVPPEIQTQYPEAKISRLSSWGGFEDKYRSYFLDPFDPLFKEVQTRFLTEQTRQLGTDHIYGADPFNEVTPPSWEPDYLASVADTIYGTMKSVDPEAQWLQMTWVYYFERKHWTNPRIKAFLRAVPQDKMTLLDYYCENTEVWKMTEQFFGQPYIWCYLGNFGGNTMLAGNLAEVDARIENAFKNGGDNMSGIGSTLEALDVNPLMYEFVFEKAWQDGSLDVDQWMRRWADRRFGKPDKNAQQAWKLLLDTVYSHPAHLGQAALTNARPSLAGSGNWTTNPHYDYDNADLFKAWELLLECPDTHRNSFEYDVVNIGRQVLSNHFMDIRDNFTAAYNAKDLARLQIYGRQMLELLDDLESLLGTHASFLLGKWLQEAKAMGANPAEKQYYEENARTILTTWGAKGQSLNDYASRTWAGLVEGYYKQRWKMFIDDVIASVENDKPFDPAVFHEKVTQFEIEWTRKTDLYASKPTGDPLTVARRLCRKYAPAMKTTYDIVSDNYQGLPVYKLTGGLSAEYAVQKAIASLKGGISHSWKTPMPGAGPTPISPRPDFLQRSIDKTVDTYNEIFGETYRFDTVILSTGIPSAPYLARAMNAPILPVHFLVGANTTKEVKAILDSSSNAGLPAYATLGHDYSLSTSQGVAWIKMLSLPKSYQKFMADHKVKNVIIFGASGNSGGESAAKKFKDDTDPLGNGSVYLMHFAGNNAEKYLGQTISDFNPENLGELIKIPDWEAAVSDTQVTAISQDIAQSLPGVSTYRLTSNAGDGHLWKLGSYLMLEFFQKNDIPVKGITLNPYLIAHPVFESYFGYVPYLYWQGGNPQGYVDTGLNGFMKTTVQKYAPDIDFSQLKFWVNSTHNFGGPSQGVAMSAALKQNGFIHIIDNDYPVDEEWDLGDGINAPCEVRAKMLTESIASLNDWNTNLTFLTLEDLNTISIHFPEITVEKQ